MNKEKVFNGKKEKRGRQFQRDSTSRTQTDNALNRNENNRKDRPIIFKNIKHHKRLTLCSKIEK